MHTVSFLYGFLTALALVGFGLTALYIALKQSRQKKVNIKGYLDLIPDLTEEQRSRLQEIRRVFLPKVEKIRQDMRFKRSELAELLFRDPTDRERIYAASACIIERQSELEHEVIEHILEEKELLTPLQKRRFYEIIAEQFSWGGLGVHDIRAGKSPAASSPILLKK